MEAVNPAWTTPSIGREGTLPTLGPLAASNGTGKERKSGSEGGLGKAAGLADLSATTVLL